MHDARHDAQHAPTAPALAPTEVAPAFETPHAELRDALIGEAAGPWYDALRQEVAERDAGVDRSVSTASNAYRLDRMTGGSEAVPEAVAARLAGRTHTDPAEREAARAQLGAMAELLGSKPFIGLDDPLEHKDPRAVREPREHGRRTAKNKRGKRAEEARQEQETARAEGEQARAQEGAEKVAQRGASGMDRVFACGPDAVDPGSTLRVPQPAPAPAPAPSPRAALQQAGDALGAQDFAPGLAAVPGPAASAPAVQAASAAPAAPDGDLARAFMNHHWDSSHWEAIRFEAGVFEAGESSFGERIAGSPMEEGRLRDIVVWAESAVVGSFESGAGVLPLPPNPWRVRDEAQAHWTRAEADMAVLESVDPENSDTWRSLLGARAAAGSAKTVAQGVLDLADFLDAGVIALVALGAVEGATLGAVLGPAGAGVGGAAGGGVMLGVSVAWGRMRGAVRGLATQVKGAATGLELVLELAIGLYAWKMSCEAAAAGRMVEHDAWAGLAGESLSVVLEAAVGELKERGLKRLWGEDDGEEPAFASAEDVAGRGQELTQSGTKALGEKGILEAVSWADDMGVGGALRTGLADLGRWSGLVSSLTDRGDRFRGAGIAASGAVLGPLVSARQGSVGEAEGRGERLLAVPDPRWTPKGLEAARAMLWSNPDEDAPWSTYLADAAEALAAEFEAFDAWDTRRRNAAWVASQHERVATELMALSMKQHDLAALGIARGAASAGRMREDALSEACARLACENEALTAGAERVSTLLGGLPEALRGVVEAGLQSAVWQAQALQSVLQFMVMPSLESAHAEATLARQEAELAVERVEARLAVHDENLGLIRDVAAAYWDALGVEREPSGVAAQTLRAIADDMREEVDEVITRRRALRDHLESEAPAEIDAWVGAHGQAVEDYFQPEAPTHEIDAIGEVVNALRDQNLLDDNEHDQALTLRADAESEVGKIGQAAVARVWAIGDRVAELAEETEARGGVREGGDETVDGA